MTINLARRREIVDTITSLTEEKGFPPSIREIAAENEVSSATIMHYLNRMKRDGVVTWTPGKNRTLKVVNGRR